MLVPHNNRHAKLNVEFIMTEIFILFPLIILGISNINFASLAELQPKLSALSNNSKWLHLLKWIHALRLGKLVDSRLNFNQQVLSNMDKC